VISCMGAHEYAIAHKNTFASCFKMTVLHKDVPSASSSY